MGGFGLVIGLLRGDPNSRLQDSRSSLPNTRLARVKPIVS
jgi:hypothetical protein